MPLTRDYGGGTGGAQWRRARLRASNGQVSPEACVLLRDDLSQALGPAGRHQMLPSKSQRSCQMTEVKRRTCRALYPEQLRTPGVNPEAQLDPSANIQGHSPDAPSQDPKHLVTRKVRTCRGSLPVPRAQGCLPSCFHLEPSLSPQPGHTQSS